MLTHLCLCVFQSEEDRLAMERRIQLAEERSHNNSKRDSEAEELRRELEEARLAERMVKMQLEETRGPLSPPLPPSTAANTTNNFIARVCTLRLWLHRSSCKDLI